MSKNDDNELIKREHNFYILKLKRGRFDGLSIKKAKIVDKLRERNFFRYDIDTETNKFVEIKTNLVREVSQVYITDKFFEYINALKPNTVIVKDNDDEGGQLDTELSITPEMLRAVLFERITEYFSKAIFCRLVPDGPIIIKTDTRREKFLYFENGFVTITENGFVLNNYDKLDAKIWENQRLSRSFTINQVKGDFERFVERIAGHKDDGEISEAVQNRIRSIKTIIGYCLHGFFDYERKAVIFTDERISDDDEPNGRTGKTLFVKAMSKVLNYDENSHVYTEINGKDFLTNKDFRYQYCSMETQLVHLNDLERNTPFEMFFNDITEGISVNIKNTKPFKKNVKLIISTNRTIRIDGESAKARAIQFEFSDYFNSTRTPYKEFGHWMFTEWDAAQWNAYDTFIISCIVDFFKFGLIEPATINLHRRTLIDHTCHEFVDFMDDIFTKGFFEVVMVDEAEGQKMSSRFHIEPIYNTRIDKSYLYHAFLQAYPDDFSPSKFKQRTFTNWLRQYTKHHGNLKTISKDNQTEGRAGGADWIIFEPKHTVEQ